MKSLQFYNERGVHFADGDCCKYIGDINEFQIDARHADALNARGDDVETMHCFNDFRREMSIVLFAWRDNSIENYASESVEIEVSDCGQMWRPIVDENFNY